jgi:protein involved in polysaccharide export with SLBB domain
MPYRVKVHFEKPYTAVTVSNGHYPYVDTHGMTLENLNVGAGAMYQISVALINGAGTVVIDATDGADKIRFRYAIPFDCDNDGNIEVPKIAAVSQSDVDKLTEEIEAIKQRIGP